MLLLPGFLPLSSLGRHYFDPCLSANRNNTSSSLCVFNQMGIFPNATFFSQPTKWVCFGGEQTCVLISDKNLVHVFLPFYGIYFARQCISLDCMHHLHLSSIIHHSNFWPLFFQSIYTHKKCLSPCYSWACLHYILNQQRLTAYQLSLFTRKKEVLLHWSMQILHVFVLLFAYF